VTLPVESNRQLLELAKREENVKREAMNNNKKNKGMTPGDVGLIK